MTPEDFQFTSKLLKERTGLLLPPDKLYLLESRLMPLVRRSGLSDLGELVSKLRKGGSPVLERAVIDAMMTTESSFFRDKKPFEYFQTLILDRLLDVREDRRHIRIWCAAAAGGQEPYSIAICLREAGEKLGSRRTGILATDISSTALQKADSGLYSQFEVQRGLPVRMLVKYFTRRGGEWQAGPELRELIQFREFNLLDGFTGLGRFEVIFCRNVLIYFDLETRRNVLERLAGQLTEDGYLLLGGAETVIGLTDAFVPISGYWGVYQRNPAYSGRRAASLGRGGRFGQRALSAMS